jgi:hypothetical protein
LLTNAQLYCCANHGKNKTDNGFIAGMDHTSPHTIDSLLAILRKERVREKKKGGGLYLLMRA